jgi:hypothetical protein
MAVEKADYGGGGIWGMLAAREAGQSRERIAQTQADVQRQSLAQQGSLARGQMGLEKQKIASNQQLAQSGQQQQMELAKLSTEQQEKDRNLQAQLSSKRNQLQRDMAEAARRHQIAMASENFDRAREMWGQQRNFFEQDRNFRIAYQQGLLGAQMQHALRTEKSRREFALKLMKAHEDAKAKTKVWDQNVADTKKGLKDFSSEASPGGLIERSQAQPMNSNWSQIMDPTTLKDANEWSVKTEALRELIDELGDKKTKDLTEGERTALQWANRYLPELLEYGQEFGFQSANPHVGATVVSNLGAAVEESNGNMDSAYNALQSQVRMMLYNLGVEAPTLPPLPTEQNNPGQAR